MNQHAPLGNNIYYQGEDRLATHFTLEVKDSLTPPITHSILATVKLSSQQHEKAASADTETAYSGHSPARITPPAENRLQSVRLEAFTRWNGCESSPELGGENSQN